MTGRMTKVNEMRETTVRRSLREVLGRHAPWVAALAVPSLAVGGPTGEDVIRGAADVQRPDGVTTEIDQFTDQVAIEWQTFDVAGEEFVIFNQPSASSIALNRVVGGAPSTILGTIQANGQVFLVNGQGITFGEGAVVDAQGFVASTLDIADDDFMNGDLVFEKGSAAPDAEVRNYGTIQAAADGYVVLAGDYVENEGVIAAQAGHVILGAGSAITLDVEGDGLVNFAVDEATLAELAGVNNAGDILADGSMVIMTAEVANSLVTTAVNQEGLVEARGVAEDDGIIYLAAEGGDIAMSGQLVADGVDGADGGTVVLKAGGDLDFTGSISAAGDEGAEGGFVELSADGGLAIRGEVDTGGGEMLIDPATLTLQSGSGAPGSGAVVGVDFVENALDAGSDVSLIASNSINASYGVSAISATGTGDLFFGIGTTSSGTLGNLDCNFGVCATGTSVVFVPGPGGMIDLDGVSISVGGALSFSASYGFLNAGSLAAGSDVNINAGGAVIGATTGGFSEAATSYGAFGTAFGGRDTFSFDGSPITAGGDVNVSVASSGFGQFDGVFAAGPIDAGGNVTIIVNDTASGLSYGAGIFILDSHARSDFAGSTFGEMPVFHSSEQSDGATVTAGGDITITASGSASAEVITGALDAPSGNIVISASANANIDGDAAISVIGTQSESDASWGSGTSPSFIPSNGTFSETVSGGGVSAGGTVSLAATGGTGSYGFAEVLTGDIFGGASINLDAEAGDAAEVLAVSTLSESGSFGTPGSGFSASASGAAIGADGPLSVSAQAGSLGFGGFVRLGDLDLGSGAELDASRDIEIHGAVRGSGPLMASAGSAFWLFPGASIGSSADRFDGEVGITAGNDAGIHGDIWLGSSGGAPADLAVQTGFGMLTVQALDSDVVVDVRGAASFDGYGVQIQGGFNETVTITADDGDTATTFDDVIVRADFGDARIEGGFAEVFGDGSEDAGVAITAGDDIDISGGYGGGVVISAGVAQAHNFAEGGVAEADADVDLSAGDDIMISGTFVSVEGGVAEADAYGGSGDVAGADAQAQLSMTAGGSALLHALGDLEFGAGRPDAFADGAGTLTASAAAGLSISAASLTASASDDLRLETALFGEGASAEVNAYGGSGQAVATSRLDIQVSGNIGLHAADRFDVRVGDGLGSGADIFASGSEGVASATVMDHMSLDAGGDVTMTASSDLRVSVGNIAGAFVDVDANNGATASLTLDAGLAIDADGDVILDAGSASFISELGGGAGRNAFAGADGATANLTLDLASRIAAGDDLSVLASDYRAYGGSGAASFAQVAAFGSGASASMDITMDHEATADGDVFLDLADDMEIRGGNGLGAGAVAEGMAGGQASLSVTERTALAASGSVSVSASDIGIVGGAGVGAGATAIALDGDADVSITQDTGIHAEGGVSLDAFSVFLGGGFLVGGQGGGGLASESVGGPLSHSYGSWGALASGSQGAAERVIDVTASVEAGGDVTVSVSDGFILDGGPGPAARADAVAGGTALSETLMQTGIFATGDVAVDAGFVVAEGAAMGFGEGMGGAQAFADSATATATLDNHTGLSASGDVSVTAASFIDVVGGSGGVVFADATGGTADADAAATVAIDGTGVHLSAAAVNVVGGGGGGESPILISPAQLPPPGSPGIVEAIGSGAGAGLDVSASVSGDVVTISAGSVAVAGAGLGTTTGSPSPQELPSGASSYLVIATDGGSAAVNQQATITGGAVDVAATGSVFVGGGSSTTTGGAGQVDGQGIVSGSTVSMAAGTDLDAALGELHAVNTMDLAAAGTLTMGVITTGDLLTVRTDDLVAGSLFSFSANSGATVQFTGIDASDAVGFDGSEGGTTADIDYVLADLDLFTGVDYLVGGGTNTGGVLVADGGSFDAGARPITVRSAVSVTGSNAISGTALTFGAGTAGTVDVAIGDGSFILASAATAVIDATGAASASLTLGGSAVGDVGASFGDAGTVTGSGAGDLVASAAGLLSATGLTVGGSGAFAGATVDLDSVSVGGDAAVAATGDATARGLTVTGDGGLTAGGALSVSSASLGGAGSFAGTSVALDTVDVGTDLSAQASGTLTVADVIAGGAGSFSGSTVIADGALSAGGGATLTGDEVQLVGTGASYDVTTVTTDLVIGGVAAVTVDNTSVTDPTVFSFTDGFGSAALNFGGNATLATGASGTALAIVGSGDLDVSGQSIGMDSLVSFTAVGDILVSEVAIDAPEGAVSMVAGGSIQNAQIGSITAGALGLIAGDSIILDETTLNIGSGTILDFGGDAEVFGVLSDAGVEPTSSSPNATLIAGDQIILGDYSMTGDYLYIQTDDLDFDGSVTVPGGTAVQLSPFTEGASFGLEDTLASLQDVNYGNDTHLSGFAGITIVLGNSAHLGDFGAGENGEVDIGDLNLLVATQGEVEGLDSIVTTGLVGTLEGGLARVEFFEPTTDEIDPGSGSNLDPDQGELEPDEDEDDEDTGDDGEDVDGDEEDPPGSVRHRTSDDPGLVCE